MVWCSTTSIARVSEDSRAEVWKQINAAQEGPERDKARICCYYMQGICIYPEGCECSHDMMLGWEVGCSYRHFCNFGHGAIAQTIRGGQGILDPGGGHDGGCLFRARAAANEDAAYVECRGCPFDGTDPLWGELSGALMQPEEDIGDFDMPHSFLAELSKKGIYKLVEDSDEWLCLPSSILLHSLEGIQDRFMVSRHDWIVDDMIDARDFWNQVWTSLSRRGKVTQVSSKRLSNGLNKIQQVTEQAGVNTTRRLSDEAEEKLRRIADDVDKTLQKAFDSKPAHTTTKGRLDEVGLDFFKALEAARDTVVEMKQLCCQFARERWERFQSFRSAWLVGGGRLLSYDDRVKLAANYSFLGNPLDDEIDSEELSDLVQLPSYRLSQLLCCLDRSLFLCRSFPEVYRHTHGEDAWNCRDSGPKFNTEPVVGEEVAVVGLRGDAESKLNGRIGLIEGYHENLSLWQIVMKESGTRLLLSREQLVKPTPMAKPTLLDLVRRAAAEGDYVLVHHVTQWPRNESID